MFTLYDLLLLPYGDKPPAPFASAALAHLMASENEAARRIGAAIGEVAEQRLDEAERAVVARIEARRAWLGASEAPIAYTDYGAADRSGRESDEAMYRGNAVSRTVGDLERRTSKRHGAALLLFKLVRAFRPRMALELGTCLGISAAYQAAAMELNGAGRLITLEGAEPIAALARETFAELGIDRVTPLTGRFQDILEDVVKAYGPFDYAFIDGHHDGRATVRYFNQILPRLERNAYLVFDDIRWSPAMLSAWETVASHPNAAVAVDMGDMGAIVLAPEVERPARFDLTGAA